MNTLDNVPKDGKYDVYLGTADAAFENPSIVNKDGDAQIVVEVVPVTDDQDNPDGTPNMVRLKVGGGTLGTTTTFGVQVDGHIEEEGEEEVIAPVVAEFSVKTISPDATVLTFGRKVRREEIPAM